MKNIEIAAALDEVADILEFQGANPFRVRAYRNGARTIRDLTEPASAICASADRQLTDIPGIGKDLCEKIGTLVATGELPMLNELRKAVPSAVLALLRVPNLGPKKAFILHEQLNIGSLDQLREACLAHKVRELKGFGTKTEETILAGLDSTEAFAQRILWADADVQVQALLEHMGRCRAVKQIEAAGSYRRGRETIGDVDLLVESTRPEQVMDHFGKLGNIDAVLARGDTKMSIRLNSGLQVDLRVVPPESFGAALQYFTGSKDHNVALRGRAKAKGLKINEYGVYRGEEYLAGRTEEDVYAALGLPCIPPVLREARKEFDWADAGRLPELVEMRDIVGDLHMHTTATDGKATLEQMVEAAQARGLKYIAITDHSKRVSMAGGLDADRLRRQWEEIDAVNSKLRGFTVLKGVEVDILEKGGLDLDDGVLSEADWVVASLHYGQNQPREQITRRILDAVENPYVSAIGHPTGRLINRRKPYDVDLDAIYAAAKQHGKFLELNANPWRLDLDDIACAAAKSHGIAIVISTDAHSISDLDKLRYGILQAGRAGLTRKDVANARPWKELKKMMRK